MGAPAARRISGLLARRRSDRSRLQVGGRGVADASDHLPVVRHCRCDAHRSKHDPLPALRQHVLLQLVVEQSLGSTVRALRPAQMGNA